MLDVVIFGLVAGVIAGIAILIVRRSNAGPADAQTREELAAARATLEERERNFEKQQQAFETKIKETFGALAAQALGQNNKQFLALAQKTFEEKIEKTDGALKARDKAFEEGFLKPLGERLKVFDEYVREIEVKREKAYVELQANLTQLTQDQVLLRKETGTLSTALRGSQVRGKWGELTLQNIAELAGLQEHCDFSSQVSVAGEDGRQRPDMIVRLPGERALIVDAKAPMNAYLDAVAAPTPEERARYLAAHAKALKTHIGALKQKAYWEQFDKAPDFVILFVPIESALGAALEADGDILAQAAADRVLIATPVTLIAMLRAAEHSWRQEKMTDNAKAISDLGRDLYDRLVKFGDHFDNVGKGIEKAVKSYNDGVGSYERMVMPGARKFKDLGAAGTGELKELKTIEGSVRAVSIPERAEAPPVTLQMKTPAEERA